MSVTYLLLDHFHIWVIACYSHWEGFDEDNFYVEVSLGWETTPYHPICTWGEDSLPCVCQAKLPWSLGSESGPGWVPLGATPSLIFLTLSASASSHTLWPQEMEKDHKPDPTLIGKEHSQPAKFCFLNDSPEHLLYFLHKKNSKTWSLPSRRIQSSWKGWVHVHMYKHTRTLAHAHANACTHAHTPSRGTR